MGVDIFEYLKERAQLSLPLEPTQSPDLTGKQE